MQRGGARKAALAAALVAAALTALVGGGTGAGATAVDQSCTVDGTPTQTGTPIVSGPIRKALEGSPLTVPLDVAVQATAQIQPGGTVTTVATATVDLGAKAHEVLVDQVQPAVVAAGYPQLASQAWVVLTLESSSVRFSLPAGTTPLGQPVATSPTVGSAASWVTGGVRVDLGTLSADTRLGPGSPTTVTVGWQAADGGAAAPRSVVLGPPTLTFRTSIDVGVTFAGAPLVGGIRADWACDPEHPATVLATTAVDDGPPPTTPGPTLPTPGPPPVVTPPTTAPTTTWPTRAVAPTTCTIDGFDRWGGWTGRTLDATGFFRTEQVDGGWWLVDPDGHPFFSQGVNHVSFDGTVDRNGVALYHDSVVARYGDRATWADAQVSRFRDWGYNTAGGWSDTEVAERMPYALLVSFTSQDFGTGVMEDLFEPSFAANAQATAAAAAGAHGDDPNLVGYWTDNELHWGPDWRPSHLFDQYLARPATAAGKQHLLAWLQARYPTFAAFAADFTTPATSWAELAAPTTASTWTPTGGQATRSAWTGEVAERYFSTTVGALRAADPHHLQLGPRMIAQTTGVPVLEAAGRWVDVASFNDYAIDPALLPGLSNADPTYLPVDHALAAQEAVVGKPILISEWGFRAADSGLPNTWPPLFPTLATQDQRAGAYQRFVSSLLATDYVVGQHFFEHSDEPAAGRFDGEDSNFGLVDGHDDPYQPVIEVSRWMHDCAYARLLAPPPTTTTTTAVATSTTTTTVPAGAPGAEAVEGDARFTG
jgi:agarase